MITNTQRHNAANRVFGCAGEPAERRKVRRNPKEKRSGLEATKRRGHRADMRRNAVEKKSPNNPLLTKRILTQKPHNKMKKGPLDD